MNDTDVARVERAIDLARESADRGDHPFGAVVGLDGEAVHEARNAVVTGDDVTAHPELRCARWVGRNLDPAERARCTLYASTEPCPMCSTAACYAGVRRVVFGTSAETVAELSGASLVLPCEDLFARAGEDVTVEGGVRAESGRAVHESYW